MYRLSVLRFREIENMSILQAIENRKMELAEKELAGTDKPIRRIASENGYRNVKTFEVAFRKRRGMSPGDFRRCGGQDADSAAGRTTRRL